MPENLAIITYETPYAPGGGIAAVMAHLPGALKDSTGMPTYVITPFHWNITKTRKAEPEMELIASIKVPFNDQLFEVDILNLKREVNWVFLKPSGKPIHEQPFYSGQRHPYDVNQTSGQNLLRDSLFFGKSASICLTTIDPDNYWVVLLQDWEAATTCLALSEIPSKEKLFSLYLTLHNSYDSGLTSADLLKIGIEPATCPGDTVLECSLPHLQNPIFTVSDQFALDLSTEVLQAEIMIPHIASQLKPRLVGANNGIFTNLSVPETVLLATRENNYLPIRKWKENNRKEALRAMGSIVPSKEKPLWGDVNEFVQDAAPWIIMAGRDDSRQKGYELACSAIKDFLMNGGQARFLFFPIPGEEGFSGINFIHDLAIQFPDSVIAFPFLFREGYFAVMKGASFGLMPSYYEPFGMANEFYLNGVVCIGRATGGLIQQIVPIRSVASYSPSVERHSLRWHAPSSKPSGFLFREPDRVSNDFDDWNTINLADYQQYPKKPNRLEMRAKLTLFQSMKVELLSCLADATLIYTSQPELYFDMIFNGISYIQKFFSWNRTAEKYTETLQAKD